MASKSSPSIASKFWSSGRQFQPPGRDPAAGAGNPVDISPCSTATAASIGQRHGAGGRVDFQRQRRGHEKFDRREGRIGDCAHFVDIPVTTVGCPPLNNPRPTDHSPACQSPPLVVPTATQDRRSRSASTPPASYSRTCSSVVPSLTPTRLYHVPVVPSGSEPKRSHRSIQAGKTPDWTLPARSTNKMPTPSFGRACK